MGFKCPQSFLGGGGGSCNMKLPDAWRKHPNQCIQHTKSSGYDQRSFTGVRCAARFLRGNGEMLKLMVILRFPDE